MISKKEKIALLHMLAIKESLTSTEFNNVLREVQKLSFDSFFSMKVNEVNRTSSIITKTSSTSPLKPKSFDFILRSLRVQDPEKYELLQQLKLNLRSGAVLKNFSDIKDLLAKLDQASLITSSKASTISNLLIYLSKKKSNEIRDIIKNHIRPNVTHDDKGFNELANYIIDPTKK
ncbi:hypothetical protein RFC90_002740 [Klebsiella aerogenes]|uniref:hypothetical protein n=1 Tax=Klebsiella aerogenes TaxID=548 RepID=UPI00277F3DAD|nr:hypothetical protein [Klebsiella aerogenes]EKZ9719378.1 hypothetical protein [Klebsiella aerogenes]MDT8883546.1 hypothetical protein [Klebsiella aerogenes]HDT1380922.1 hypothetical protein [Klebsiella aerogenes]